VEAQKWTGKEGEIKPFHASMKHVVVDCEGWDAF
jgi:hypothetical protein